MNTIYVRDDQDPHGLQAKHPDWELKYPDEDASKPKCKLVEFDAGGHTESYGKMDHGTYRSSCQVHGYSDPETFFNVYHWWAHHHLSVRNPAQYEGCPYIDKRKALETKNGMREVFVGPMVNVDLEPGAVDVCPAPSDLLALGVSGQFKQLLALDKIQKATAPKEPSALDYVDVQTYMRRWKEAGAIVGYIRDARFIPDV